ncbi:uncharacterized protein K452DRAFT_290588 [Aplosporella prunicola CBS 121167]|uniref:Pop1 N-terminal domain-containing protein n=1 Tax=Aplosporella prunicola CBS 121167 TaxID=1176127 RepID=A0A6A6B3P8_9PEZI|nr:uncharacterized protein K452DRAFT_290588 [Aplosporella prunicola CBS 121167]KAF2138446.1 hypothetical protein K452DRAFT_290588 [Aplosporella prunicola CBS 121167]
MADKRKQPPPPANGRQRKRAKTRDARTIATQASGVAFKNGEVDVDKFVKARQYEIKALEDGMARSRKGLTTRAFQGVPKELRRRTASHNVKRVPKRLRARAAREMAEDNTPTVTARRRKPSSHMRLRLETAKRLKALSTKAKARKEKKKQKAKADGDGDADAMEVTVTDNATAAIQPRTPRVKTATLKNPPTPPAKFRKRQLHKSWLPTHMFHTKRAHLTPPSEPLWRFAIPLAPTVKCYRPTHRASTTRGAVAWDMSYMSTIGLEGSETSVQGLLKALGVGVNGDPERLWGKKGEKWRKGTRAWEGWLYERDGWPQKSIAPVTVIWHAGSNSEDVEMKDASATAQNKKERRKAFIRVHPSAFLQLWNEVLKVAKMQRPTVTVEDLRFEIGSIEITGPGATEALAGALWPLAKETVEDSPEGTWKTLGPVTNLNTLPNNCLLGFDISDPRLHHPPRTISHPMDKASHSRLLQVMANWPADRTQSAAALFDRTNRLAASRSLPSQKSINRRKTLAIPGSYPEARPTDPKIPVLLYASRGAGVSTGTWTVLLPWKCVSPVWSSIMYYPLSTGGNVRLGGLEQKRQLAFEASVPWFPGDFPGTKAGMQWEERERDRKKNEWERRPKGKRTEWDSVPLAEGRKGEVGMGWACDWERVINDQASNGDNDAATKPTIYQLPSSLASQQPATAAATSLSAITTVRLALLSRGLPISCARIYRLPTTDPTLRKQWLALAPSTKSNAPARAAKCASASALPPRRPPPEAPEHVWQAHLAASLLEPPPQAGNPAYPASPDAQDLVGFVTAGNFNLADGRGTAVGGVVLAKLCVGEGGEMGEAMAGRGLCVVRNAGETVARVARWEVV